MSQPLVEVEIPIQELVDPNLLVFDGDNPNKMTSRQRAATRESLIRWGFIIPVITNKDLVVADGQQRVEVARELRLKEIPIVKLPVTDVDRRLLRQVLNKLRGEHEFYSDAEEFKRIIDGGEQELLQAMIGLTENDLNKHLMALNDDGTYGEKDLDDDLGEVECPKCGHHFVPDL